MSSPPPVSSSSTSLAGPSRPWPSDVLAADDPRRQALLRLGLDETVVADLVYRFAPRRIDEVFGVADQLAAPDRRRPAWVVGALRGQWDLDQRWPITRSAPTAISWWRLTAPAARRRIASTSRAPTGPVRGRFRQRSTTSSSPVPSRS
jgi:hypothetical protein